MAQMDSYFYSNAAQKMCKVRLKRLVLGCCRAGGTKRGECARSAKKAENRAEL
jgi:hypothetical protein